MPISTRSSTKSNIEEEGRGEAGRVQNTRLGTTRKPAVNVSSISLGYIPDTFPRLFPTRPDVSQSHTAGNQPSRTANVAECHSTNKTSGKAADVSREEISRLIADLAQHDFGLGRSQHTNEPETVPVGASSHLHRSTDLTSTRPEDRSEGFHRARSLTRQPSYAYASISFASTTGYATTIPPAPPSSAPGGNSFV